MLVNLKNLVRIVFAFEPKRTIMLYYQTQEHYLSKSQWGKLGISLEILGNLKNLDNLVHTPIALDSKHTLMIYCQHRSII